MFNETQAERDGIYNPFEDLPPDLILDIMSGKISQQQEREE
jgi:hypothetical protein